MAEFTGERVIPGKVDVDLWNEHIARYTFAARLARNKRVLDVGCGAGYGSAELARMARQVIGLDPSGEAVGFAREQYGGANVQFVQGRAEALPFASESFQLVVGFEVIEHLTEWKAMLEEARRLLAPGGQFIVSTPNRLYYEESRKQTGPNPFHEHEFEFGEFREELEKVFPHVVVFLENHAEGIVFQPVDGVPVAEVRLDAKGVHPAESHFFVAVCALGAQTGAPTYIYMPSVANVLRERETHIAKLEGELATKNQWLEQARAEHQELVTLHTKQTEELRQRNVWAERLNRELEESMARVAALQEELRREQEGAREVVAQYEEKIGELERESRAKTEWAQETEQRLTKERDEVRAELAKCMALLEQTETTLEERTRWALRLDEERQRLEAQLAGVAASRWVRMGRVIGLGPRVGNP